MADSILRLKVDSQEYDQKIKRAAEGIQQYAQKCRDAGGTLQYLDDGVLEFVQALGKMDTVATGTKQQLREMSNALTTLTQTYRGLTDEEKASPFGQELAKGIQQLTERAGQAQDAMADVQASIRNAASDTRLFDQMAQGMSVATAGFQGLTGAGKLLGIEMGNDVEVIAKLQAAMAVTNSLTTIQTALQKQSALMQGVLAARTALASAAQTALAVATGNATAAQKAFNVVANMNPYVLLATSIAAVVGAIALFSDDTEEATKKQEKMNRELQEGVDKAIEYANAINSAYSALQTYLSAVGAASWKMEDAKLQAAQDKAARMKAIWEEEMAKRPEGESVENYEARIKKAYDAYDAAKKELQKVSEEIRIHRKAVQDLLDNWENLTTDKQIRTAISAFQNLRDELKRGSKEYDEMTRRIEILQNKLKPKKTEGGSKVTKAGEKDDFQEMDEVVGLLNIQKQKLEDLQAMKPFAETEEELENINQQIAEVNAEYQRLLNLGNEDPFTEVLPPLMQMEDVLKQLNEDLKKAETPEAYQNLLSDIKAINEEMKAFKGETDKGKGKDKKSGKNDMLKLMSGSSSILSGLQSMGVELPKELQETVSVIQGLISVIEGVNTVISIFATSAIAANTAAVAANTTALAINTAVPSIFAGGGVVHAAGGFMVPGNNYSGDLVPAYLNSGEMVLNKFQQQALAGALENSGMKSVNVTGHLKGETIVLAVDRWGRRTGKGELAFWK